MIKSPHHIVLQKLVDFRETLVDMLPKTSAEKLLERKKLQSQAIAATITTENRSSPETRPKMPKEYADHLRQLNEEDAEVITKRTIDDLIKETPSLSTSKPTLK